MDFQSLFLWIGKIPEFTNGMFDSTAEMAFYAACLVILHMILMHLFYTDKFKRRKHPALNLKRSFILFILIAEIVFFTNLITVESLVAPATHNKAFASTKIYRYN